MRFLIFTKNLFPQSLDFIEYVYNGYYQVPSKEDFLIVRGKAIRAYLALICYSVIV